MTDRSIRSIDFNNVHCNYGYDGWEYLYGFKSPKTFTVHANQLHILKGDNGSGKTSFFKTLIGIVPNVSGRVVIRYNEPGDEEETPVKKFSDRH